MYTIGMFVILIACVFSPWVNYFIVAWLFILFYSLDSLQSSSVGRIVGGVIGGIAVLAIVIVGLLLVGIYFAYRKPVDRNWRHRSMLPTNTTTSASTAQGDDVALVDTDIYSTNLPDVNSSEN